MVGTIPDGYQWSVRLLSSLKGTIEQGKKEIKQVITYARQQDDFIFAKEAEALQAYLLLHLANEPEQAWITIRKSKLDPTDNPLHAFVVANIAMRTGHNDEAIRLLEKAPQDGLFHPLPFLEFMLGLTKLRRLDRNAAKHFNNFLDKFDGTHYVKEAYQKLAWQALINGDPVGYRTNMVKVSQHGNETGGGDSNAQREADAGRTPHVELVRARLLFDGGYTQKAYDQIAPLKLDQAKDLYLKLEYTYRMGRILQELKRPAEAISYFEKTLAISGDNSPYFFGCNAALQIGLMYENIEEWQKAKDYYKKCLLLNPDEYATGLHQKAKAGLSRVRKQ
jgi:tetratricopeptide (TPR) repeat protein